jgi:CheY-like chemotaxis protein/nitrogen-specific signal transduction histidine kinase
MKILQVQPASFDVKGVAVMDEEIDLRPGDRDLPSHRAADARSHFLVNTSEEIRRYVDQIVANAAEVLDSHVTVEQRDSLVGIQSSAASLLTLVNDLHDVARMEDGNFSLEETPFLLRSTIDHIVKTHSAAAAEKGLDLTHELEPGLPDRLVGDPGRFRQMLSNLIENAIRFTNVGTVRIIVEGERNRAGGITLHSSITDTGIGIPEDAQQRIFEWFTQGNPGIARNFGGIGLGLPMAARIAGRMGGRIWVESTAGLGSTFYCTATLRVGEAPDEPPKVIEAFLSATAEIPVLVISDIEDERRRLVATLGESVMSPIAVAHLEPAFRALERATERESPIRAVVLAMEDDPFVVFERFDSALTERIPVVIAVPSGKRGDATMCRRLGVAGYLAGPIVPGDVGDTVRAVIQLAEQGDTSTLVTSHWLREGRHSLEVLIADDSPTNLRLTTRMLENRDHSVTAVENGRLAVEAVRIGDFDVVLMDLQMPVMDGIEATAAIRAEEDRGRPHVPIVAMTAYDDRQHCLEAGMDGHLEKPYRPQQLFETLERIAATAKQA